MNSPLRLFEGYGIEIEYMIVDRTSREVRSIADKALQTLAGGDPDGAAMTGDVEWSNELVNHVIEAKCAAPVTAPDQLLEPLKNGVSKVNAVLAPHGACLMPSAAHPWMDPAGDAELWPHGSHEIYAAYDSIFGCNTHGWTNLQSAHLNLPFGNAEEFARLHAAVRLTLPLIPALAAASPYLDGRFTGLMDARMQVYSVNSARLPSMTGRVIPEPVFTPEAYQSAILEPLYRDLEPLDPKGVLRHEWANARGAIVRFDRDAIEIRITDSQECPLADLAVAQAIAQVVRLFADETLCSQTAQRRWDTQHLCRLLFAAVKDAERAQVNDPAYAALFGVTASGTGASPTFGDIWKKLLERRELRHPVFDAWYGRYLSSGPLARRMERRAGHNPSREGLRTLADELCACLEKNELL